MMQIHADAFEIVQVLTVGLVGGPVNTWLAVKAWFSVREVRQSGDNGVDKAITSRRMAMSSLAVFGQLVLLAAALVGILSPPPSWTIWEDGYLQASARSVAMTMISVVLAAKALTDYYYTAKIERMLVWDPATQRWMPRSESDVQKQ